MAWSLTLLTSFDTYTRSAFRAMLLPPRTTELICIYPLNNIAVNVHLSLSTRRVTLHCVKPARHVHTLTRPPPPSSVLRRGTSHRLHQEKAGHEGLSLIPDVGKFSAHRSKRRRDITTASRPSILPFSIAAIRSASRDTGRFITGSWCNVVSQGQTERQDSSWKGCSKAALVQRTDEGEH